MALLEKIKQSYHNATTEKTKFGNPEPREPLSAGLVNWMNDNQDNKKTKVYVVGLIVFIILIIGLIGWSFARVYAPTEEQQQAQTSTTTQKASSVNYLPYFNNINEWKFCVSNQKEFANNVYQELLDIGMEKGSTVYCYSDVTTTGDFNIAYMKESANSRCFQLQVKSNLDFAIKEVTENELPNVKETEELKKQEEERAARKAQQEANDKSNKEDTVTSDIDTTDTSRSVLLTNTNELKKYFPEECANMMCESLITGMKSSYGFNAVADLCCVRQETIKQEGSNYVFTAQFVDQDRNVLNVEITYNQSDGTFSGKRISN